MQAAGHCRQCGQPSGNCCCECRKDSKELLVTPDDTLKTGQGNTGAVQLGMAAFAAAKGQAGVQDNANPLPVGLLGGQFGIGQAFIGGGCCVTLSVEYAPSSPTVTPLVGVIVIGSDGTMLGWGQNGQPGAGYKVKEGIITTNPGASLYVIVENCTARVRWCEIFSC
jgi:hypothetical protein